jgi:hypothetical protein
MKKCVILHRLSKIYIVILCAFWCAIGYAIGCLRNDKIETTNFLNSKNESLQETAVLDEKLTSPNRQITSTAITKQTVLMPIKRCSEPIYEFDYGELRRTLVGTETDDPLARKRAFKVMALVGSPEEKQLIYRIILNKEEDVYLRRELIETFDWYENGFDLNALLKDDEQSELRDAVILAAENTNLSQEDRLEFENTLVNIFDKNDDNSLRIRILDYLAGSNPDRVYEIANNIPIDRLSPDVIDRIQFIQQWTEQ